MIKALLLLLCIPLVAKAHPGIGILKDSRGIIYYTDLQQVWKIEGGKRSVIVPGVHTHELYVDQHDNLYGEGGYYDNRFEKFYHYLWVYRPNGKLDTVLGMKEAYLSADFSFAKDRKGNEYYLKRFIAPHTDTGHMYRRTPEGRETLFATGNFKQVNWLHVQPNGSVLYVSNNAVYHVDSLGRTTVVKENITQQPSDKSFWNDILIWGVWPDDTGNVYVAVLSDRSVKKIDPQGEITDVYQSRGKWSPLHGVFDNEGELWVLENSDKNEVRVTKVPPRVKAGAASLSARSGVMYFVAVGGLLAGISLLLLMRRPSAAGT